MQQSSSDAVPMHVRQHSPDTEDDIEKAKPRAVSLLGNNEGFDVIARTRDRTPDMVVRNWNGDLQEIKATSKYVGRACTRGCTNYWVVHSVLFAALVFSGIMLILSLTGAFGTDEDHILFNAMIGIFMFIVGVFIPQPDQRQERNIWTEGR